MKLLEIIKKNNILKKINSNNKKINIKIVSNITLDHLIPYIEYHLNICNHNIECQSTNYDNILQDFLNFKNSDAIIIFWELKSVFDKIILDNSSLDEKEIKILKNHIKSQLNLIFKNKPKDTLVIFNYFNINSIKHNYFIDEKVNKLCDDLNYFLEKNSPLNFKLVNLNDLYILEGLEKNINLNLYKENKIIYTPKFYYKYSLHITPILLSKFGNFKKVLVLDCDNTLWKGIISEDTEFQIEYDIKTNIGYFFYFVQLYIKSLKNIGAIICICSKNNFKEVNDFISKNKMILHNEDFTILKINWENKEKNIIDISTELNLSLSSFVFIDDSDFEIDLINKFLPQVHTLKVPQNLKDYPSKFKELFNYFDFFDTSKEDLTRSKYYKQEKNRTKYKTQFNSIDDFLKSLKINLKVTVNDLENINRLHKMINKTNQFNLTNKRYSYEEILNLINKSNYEIISFSFNDIFGDSGITGLTLIEYKNESACIDLFLMSCRILGRKIEYAFFDYVIDYLKNKKIVILKAKFQYSEKNEQVINFYDNLGMKVLEKNNSHKLYHLNILDYKKRNLQFIKII